MMKYIKRTFSLLVAAVLAFGVVGAAAGCDDGGTKTLPEEDVYYTVAFNVNCEDDVRAPASQDVKAGEKATRPQDPYRADYRLEGWYTEKACTNLFDFDTPIMSHRTLYAKWADATASYTVIFEANGGSGSPASASVKDGELLSKPTDPVRVNMFFDGWYLDNTTFAEEYDFSSPVKESFTLYAKWIKAIAVTYDFNYRGAPASVTKQIPEGTAAEQIVPEERAGFVFGGWYTDAECTKSYRNEPVTEDLTLYAGWASEEAQKYTYTFHYNYTTDPESFTMEIAEGGNAGTVKPPEREGYEFDGWFLDESGTQSFDLFEAADRDRTLWAKWTELFTVTFSLNYEDKILTQKEVRDGETVAAPSDPERDYCEFIGWYTEKSCETEYVFTTPVKSSFTLFAGWKTARIQYVFEAEYVDLTGVRGTGYSNEAEGAGMIQKDMNGEAGASNGFWVGFMYISGCSVSFEITSDRAVSDVELTLRLSGELQSKIELSSTQYTVAVNQLPMSFKNIVIDGIDPSLNGKRKEFTDFTLGNISLKEGKNVITITTSNSVPMTGKLASTSFLLDCLKLTTDAVLTWDPKEDNLIGRR